MSRRELQPALVLGGIHLVRCLGKVGVPVTLAAPGRTPDAMSRYCRAVAHVPPTEDPEQHDAVVEALMAIPWPVGTTPSLFYQGDPDTLLVSRYRERLAQRYRFVIAPPDLIEATVDKANFLAMAIRLGLPIPETRMVSPQQGIARQLATWNHFPCIAKPAVRTHWFGSALTQMDGGGGLAKAVRMADPTELARLLPLLETHSIPWIFQEYIPGGEDRIVSFHAYLRPDGECVAAFTGRKIRTFPRSMGMSTYLQLTDDARTRALGLEIVRKMGFHGVLKIDFKEDPRDGRLHLLEINPRFNLWHYPAAVAGANIPALVYRDLYGLDWPLPTQVHPGLRWLALRSDIWAFRELHRAGEMTFPAWLRSLCAPSVYDSFAWDDPMPAVAACWRELRKRVLPGKGAA